MKFFLLSILTAFPCSVVTAAGGATEASPSLIVRLVNEAVHRHPKMDAERARSDAALAAMGTVRLWEDPQLGLGLTAASREMREDDGDIRLGVEQMLPRRGLFRAGLRRAAAEWQEQEAARRLTANELGLAVAQAALELALADDVTGLQAEELRWLETIVKTATERAKNPDGTAAETLRLEGELALRRQRLAAAQRQRAQLARKLNLLLGRNGQNAWSSLTLPSDAPVVPALASLKARLEESSPQLAGARSKIAGAQAEAEAAREKARPVYTAGLETNTYSGGGVQDTMFSLKVTLPWINRAAYRADAARADQLHAASGHDLAAQRRELLTQLTALVTEAENNRLTSVAYGRDVLPKAEKALEITQGAWVSSKATLLEVLDARRALIDARQEQKRALAAQQVAIHSIDALTGNLVSSPSQK